MMHNNLDNNNINNELYQMSLRQMSKHELICLLTDRDNQIKQLHEHMHNILQNLTSNKDCTNCLYFDIETFYGVCDKHGIVLNDVEPCEDYEKVNQ